MIKRLLMVVSTFVFVAVFASESLAWTVSCQTDEMDDSKSCYASSRSVAPNQAPDWPYHDSVAFLGVGCEQDKVWAYIGFSGDPNLTGSQTEDGYNIHTFRVRWDDQQATSRKFTQDWGSRFFHWSGNDKSFANKLMESEQLKVEVHYHSGGRRIFTFPLASASHGIMSAYERCGYIEAQAKAIEAQAKANEAHRQLIINVQRELVRLGYDLEVDGVVGPVTQRHIRDFQRGIGRSQTGTVTTDLLTWLRAEADSIEVVINDAETGNAKAQVKLGGRYRFGRGIAQNYRKAYIWYSLALMNGRKAEIIAAQEIVAGKLSPAELSAAKQEVKRREAEIQAKQ